MYQRRRATQAELDQGADEIRRADERLRAEAAQRGELPLPDTPAEETATLVEDGSNVVSAPQIQDGVTDVSQGLGHQHGAVVDPPANSQAFQTPLRENQGILRTPEASTRGRRESQGSRSAQESRREDREGRTEERQWSGAVGTKTYGRRSK